MNRQEAIMVLREILEAYRDLIEMNYVSLSSSESQIHKGSNGCELHIKCTLNDRLRQCLTPILEKHQLRMKESNGSVIIYTPK